MLVAVAAASLCAGCAGASPVQIGQAAGSIAGSAIAPGVGTQLGTLVGLVAGLLVQGQVDKVTEKRERVELGSQMASGMPAPATPQEPVMAGTPTRVWVDEAVQSGRMIAGHFDTRDVL